MHYSVERLLEGDTSIVNHYVEAKEKWEEFFSGHGDESIEEWAKWLGFEQIPFFEHRCGGRWKGQEVMAWSGFGTLYATGPGFTERNEEMARKLAQAFASSMCSIEVKYHAARAAESYGVAEKVRV